LLATRAHSLDNSTAACASTLSSPPAAPSPYQHTPPAASPRAPRSPHTTCEETIPPPLAGGHNTSSSSSPPTERWLGAPHPPRRRRHRQTRHGVCRVTCAEESRPLNPARKARARWLSLRALRRVFCFLFFPASHHVVYRGSLSWVYLFSTAPVSLVIAPRTTAQGVAHTISG
jgi:hypothetical protein